MTCACGKSWMTWNAENTACFDSENVGNTREEYEQNLADGAEYAAIFYHEDGSSYSYDEYITHFYSGEHVVRPHAIAEGKSLADVVESIRNKASGYGVSCGYTEFGVDVKGDRIVTIEAYMSGNGNGFSQIHPLVSEYSLTTGAVRVVDLANHYLTHFSFGMAGTFYTPLREDEVESVIAALYRCSIDVVGMHWQTSTDDLDLHMLAERITNHPLPVWGYTSLVENGSAYSPCKSLGRISKYDEIYTENPSAFSVVDGFLTYQFPDENYNFHRDWIVMIGDGHHGSNGAAYYGYHPYAAWGNVPVNFRDYRVSLVTEEIDTGAFRTAPLAVNQQ